MTQRSGQLGFTLMEAVIAITMLAIAATGIMTLTSNLFLSDQAMRDAQQSQVLLQACVDDIITTRRQQGAGAALDCAELNALDASYQLSVSSTSAEICPASTSCQQLQVIINHNGQNSDAVQILLVEATDD